MTPFVRASRPLLFAAYSPRLAAETSRDRAVGVPTRGQRRGFANWKILKLSGAQNVRDLWRQSELDKFENQFPATRTPQGVTLLIISKN
jgi:hypothetical protein